MPYNWIDLCVSIYQDFWAIVQVLNLTSMILCAFLVYKGRHFPETTKDPLQNVDKPLAYLFYRGIELHPRIFEVDVKQVKIISTFKTIYFNIDSFILWYLFLSRKVDAIKHLTATDADKQNHNTDFLVPELASSLFDDAVTILCAQAIVANLGTIFSSQNHFSLRKPIFTPHID